MASYSDTVRFVGIVERGIRRMEAIRIAAKKQMKNKLELKAVTKIAEWQKVKASHLKSLHVSAGDGFSVQAISISKKGMMVVASHSAMKKPVTRHLLRKNGIYTGRAPFGADLFIEYKVTIAGDTKMLALKTNPVSGTIQVLDNAA